MSILILLLAGGLGIGFVVLIGVIAMVKMNKGSSQVTDLSSQSRIATRPLRTAVERLERLVEQNKDRPEVKVIGIQAMEAATKLRDQAMKWAVARDELAPIARREGGSGRATELLAHIDGKLSEATAAVEDMATRIGEAAVSSYQIPDEDGLDELVKRLESLGHSMDEAKDTLNVRLQ